MFPTLSRNQWLVILLIIYFLFLWLFPLGLISIVQDRLEIKVSGFWYPKSLLPGHFVILKPRVDWKDRFQVQSGEIEIDFKLSALMRSQMEIDLEGRNLNVTMGEKYRDISSRKEVQIGRVSAELEILPTGEVLVHTILVDSSEIQLNLKGK